MMQNGGTVDENKTTNAPRSRTLWKQIQKTKQKNQTETDPEKKNRKKTGTDPKKKGKTSKKQEEKKQKQIH